MQRILVAEDNASLRTLIQEILKANCYNVVSAVWNAQIAITFFENNGEADLIITDLEMPEMDGVTDGFTLIRWVKNNRPNIPVILVTGQAYNDDVCHEAREAGAREVIGKPFSCVSLLEAVENALNQPDPY